MDVPVNLSHILFVCTANNLSTIPAPLLDRMEVLEVSGYVSEEKAEIARRYLGPQAKKSAGLGPAEIITPAEEEGSSGESEKGIKKEQGKEVATTSAQGDGADVMLTDEAIDVLIKYYCRESGVRNLKKSIDKVSTDVSVFGAVHLF